MYLIKKRGITLTISLRFYIKIHTNKTGSFAMQITQITNIKAKES